jgi:hypothetical protein
MTGKGHCALELALFGPTPDQGLRTRAACIRPASSSLNGSILDVVASADIRCGLASERVLWSGVSHRRFPEEIPRIGRCGAAAPLDREVFLK